MFVKFPSIGSFAAVVKTEAHRFQKYGVRYQTMTFRPKVKLHGTNAGITLTRNEVIPQKKSAVVTIESDNAGFARWVHDSTWSTMSVQGFTVFGEWAGPGIQKGVGVSAIDKKIFAIFSLLDGDEMVICPDRIKSYFPGKLPEDTYILPWADEALTVDMTSRESLEEFAKVCSDKVLEVESEDPWVKEVFGVSGIGEGYVYYPVSLEDEVPGAIKRDRFSSYSFKAKGEKHRVNKEKVAVEVDPVLIERSCEFADLTVTEARLDQALTEIGLDKKLTGKFIGWIAQDILKDVKNGLIELPEDVEWKKLTSQISKVSRIWYFEKLEEEAFKL